MPMYHRMLRAKTIDTSGAGTSGTSGRPVVTKSGQSAGGTARKSIAEAGAAPSKKYSVPASPSKSCKPPVQAGTKKKYSVGAAMMTQTFVPPLDPPSISPMSSIKKQKWSFAFKKRWFSSSTSGPPCSSTSKTTAKPSGLAKSIDLRRQSEGCGYASATTPHGF
uniref:Uncharacterized protein n=1 Tax=Ditylenchus dipsaci TaxID=166011 RepID=A0A915CLZ1_9BILA